MASVERRSSAHSIQPRPKARTLKLDISFVGTGLHGWQSQAKGNTGHDELAAALRSIQVGASSLTGCSRTDSGVHARRFCAHVDLTKQRSCEQVLKGLNAALSPKMRIHRVTAVSGEFHARFGSEGKAYKYFLYLGPVAPPALAPYLWAWQGALDPARLSKAARLFEGTHDFSLFTTADGRERNTTRQVKSCLAERSGDFLVITVEGPSFLHRMVRCIAGALVAIGSGKMDEAELAAALSGQRSKTIIHALPAQALHLWEIAYGRQEASESFGEWPKPPAWVLEDIGNR